MWFTIWVNLIIYNYFICLVMCIYKILRNFPVATSFLLSVFFLFFYRWSIQKVKLTQKSYSKFSTPHGPHLTWPYPFLSLLICNQPATKKKKKTWYKQIQYLQTTNKNINHSLSLSLSLSLQLRKFLQLPPKTEKHFGGYRGRFLYPGF